mgnify:CR=1 FL=1
MSNIEIVAAKRTPIGKFMGSLSGFSNRAYKYNGFSDSSNTPILGTGGFTTNCSFVYVQQTGHSIDDDRVSAIQQSGGIALSAEL